MDGRGICSLLAMHLGLSMEPNPGPPKHPSMMAQSSLFLPSS